MRLGAISFGHITLYAYTHKGVNFVFYENYIAHLFMQEVIFE